MSGDISQANEIFVSAEHYFKRGLLDKRNGQMLFTIGLLEYFNERFEAAVKFFDSAEKAVTLTRRFGATVSFTRASVFSLRVMEIG